jgi:hypothetical protein
MTRSDASPLRQASADVAHPRSGGRPAAVASLQWIALAGLAAGVWATWPLWTGMQVFPQIPWLSAATAVPVAVDRWLLALCGAAGIGIAVGNGRVRAGRTWYWSTAAFLLAAVALVLLNQHRMQAWVLHLLGVLSILWLAPNARGLVLLRAFAISVYVHSAASRCDRASLELQWDLIARLLERWEAAPPFVSGRVQLMTAALFALAELAVAILLTVRRSRGIGLWLSLAMHGGLLVALGPLGLDQHAGVLVWNGVWIAQNRVLFGGATAVRGEAASVVPHAGRSRTRLASGFAGLLIAAPLLAPWGLWDNWPSWRLYSARPATVAFSIKADRVGDLPATMQEYVGPPEPLSEWRPLSLDAWSFSELHCPVYPQERFRLAVVLAVTRAYALGEDVRLVTGSPPDRWTGERQIRERTGEYAIAARCEHFLVNVAPRERSAAAGAGAQPRG